MHGLVKCVKEDSKVLGAQKQEWEIIKDRGVKRFAPEKGGCYEIFNERPLRQEIKAYCEMNVQCLPDLYEVYTKKLDEGDGGLYWRVMITAETDKWLEDSMSAGYNPHGQHKALAPVLKPENFRY